MIYKGTHTYYNSDIYHHGVKGMKWGVRKARVSSSGSHKKRKHALPLFSKEKATTSSDKSSEKRSRPGKVERKKVVDMTNDELQQRINRMRLEQQYKELTSKKKEISKGALFVKRVTSAVQTTAQIAEGAAKIYKSYNAIFGDGDKGDKSKKSSSEKKKNSTDEKQQSDNQSEKSQSKKQSVNTKAQTKTQNSTRTDTRDYSKAFEGTVESNGSATSSNQRKRKNHSTSSRPDVVDAEYWSDVVNTATTALSVAENFSSAYSNIKNTYGGTPISALPPVSSILALPPARR